MQEEKSPKDEISVLATESRVRIENLEKRGLEFEDQDSLYEKSGLQELEDIKPVVPEDKGDVDDFWD